MAMAIVLSAPDGQVVASELGKLLQTYPGVIVHQGAPQPGPELWEQVVVLFVLSPGLMADPGQISYATSMAGQGFPLVPVVADLRTFHFDSIPPDLDVLRARNAMGVSSADVDRLRESIEGNLGLGAFMEDKEVFISYLRKDAEPVARAIETYLSSQRYSPFIDTRDIPGGAVVQERVMRALHRKDFVLFLDSAHAGNSPWVRAEIIEAFSQRIPVCTVRTDPNQAHLGLLRDRPSVTWDPANPNRLELVMRMISRGIAARQSLDARVDRTLADLARVYGLTVQGVGPRRYQLTRGARSLLLEYEDAVITLERLHELYRWLAAPPRAAGLAGAVFLCGDNAVFPLTSEAVRWARGQEPLQVVSIAELAAEIGHSFA
jgi:hypothetical protein